jgi:two-component system, NarL family, nitrate/nitrite sensor histidine kinase NarX
MKTFKHKKSLIISLSIALAGIVLLGISSMLISYWLSERAENDSLAINLAGSLRMQTYRLGLIATQYSLESPEWIEAQKKLEQTWEHPVFIPFLHDKPQITVQYQTAFENWKKNIIPLFRQIAAGGAEVTSGQQQILLDQQIVLLDELVSSIQHDAEKKIRSLRLVQVIALFSTLLVSALVIYSLKVKVEQPLSQLTTHARRVTRGDFSHQISSSYTEDELGVLAKTFDLMTRSIANSHDQLEQQVEEKTRALRQSNNALQFLYETAKFIIEKNSSGINYDEIISRLSNTISVGDIELCLMTTEGNLPYLQIKPASEINEELCNKKNCSKCLSSRGVVEVNQGQAIYRFQLMRDERHYGLIICRVAENQLLSQWQEQLIQSTTDQLALGMSLKTDEDQSRRLAVLQERNAIARELHDSLAQALSYLKIQVTRLNKAIDYEDKLTMEDVADELRVGLNNAYRQLRELLTTFRLKIDGNGLRAALEVSVEQMRAQKAMDIHLDFALNNVPLSPNEEIHLLQIIREGSQNAIHHSEGKNLNIKLWQADSQSINLSITDDGVGLPAAPEKINHYGLAIMKERARHLGGDLSIQNQAAGGVVVHFDFLPDFIKKRRAAGVIVSDKS